MKICSTVNSSQYQGSLLLVKVTADLVNGDITEGLHITITSTKILKMSVIESPMKAGDGSPFVCS